ncbi:hypothetical protein [Pseudoteredinibacter isoporae]|uniref:hypothetical protein n=1 Tax=Pseudoteredinibacter isoporae TaxID=570281 RepID=UPI00310275BF
MPNVLNSKKNKTLRVASKNPSEVVANIKGGIDCTSKYEPEMPQYMMCAIMVNGLNISVLSKDDQNVYLGRPKAIWWFTLTNNHYTNDILKVNGHGITLSSPQYEWEQSSYRRFKKLGESFYKQLDKELATSKESVEIAI